MQPSFHTSARGRREAVAALISIGIGILFGIFYALTTNDARLLPSIGIGVGTGIGIVFWITLLRRLFADRIERMRTAAPIARSLMFFAGGILGWVSAQSILWPLFHIGVSPEFLFTPRMAILTMVIGLVAVGVGASATALTALRRRLEETIAELKEREWAEKELELARSIQMRLLPPPLVEGEGYTVAARNLPAHFVAGDFYDIVRLEDGSVVIVVADVAGKGLGASLIMASVKAVLPFVARETPARAMSMLNAKLLNELSRREFVALAYARLQPNDGSLEILNAGFPEPYLVSHNEARPLVTNGTRLPLGIRSDAAYVALTTRIERGERLVFVSDGIPEAPAHGEPLGYERMQSIFANVRANGASEYLETLLATVRSEVDEGLEDDWTAVVVERA